MHLSSGMIERQLRWKQQKHTLPETNIAPENGWLEDYPASFWVWAYFQMLLLLVSEKVVQGLP